jgi:hypothetical protein
LDSVRVPSKICDGAAALAGTAKPTLSSTGDAGAVFEKSSSYVRTLRFTLPFPVSGSPGTVAEGAEREAGPREANVANDNSLAKCIGSFMSTKECELGPNSSPTCASSYPEWALGRYPCGHE